MKLWLLLDKGNWTEKYDVYNGHIIRAETELEAREMCFTGDERKWGKVKYPWMTPELTSCEELTTTGHRQYIMGDYRAG